MKIKSISGATSCLTGESDLCIVHSERSLSMIPYEEAKQGHYAQWKTAENWKNLFRIGSESWFREMARYAKPDAHLYEVCYLLDKMKDKTR